MQKENAKNQIVRPPIVVVLGHIDHGKSTLLDHIRQTNTTEKEAGGITQHIAAYEAIVGDDKRKITFLDTPGHEAFCAIRERGSKIADIAVLVISSEDGVKPQTIEAIKCIEQDQTPFIVAINKIDKPNANIEKTKQDLAEQQIFVEGWGGTVPTVNISAKLGTNVDELLEIILLQADILELKTENDERADGFVVESHKNAESGVSATLIIKNGTLKKGDIVATKGGFVSVRTLELSDGTQKDSAFASSPVIVTGWSGIPTIGEPFYVFASKKEAEEFSKKENGNSIKNTKPLSSGKKILPLIIKTDAQGSLEAIENELAKLELEKVCVKVISSGVGNISESDIKTAIPARATVIGFNTVPDKSAGTLAMRDNVDVKNFSIIYELTDWAKEKLAEMIEEEVKERILGKAKILKTFSKDKDKQVVGGRVEEGEIKSGLLSRIYRRDNLLGEGRIRELQSQKIKTGTVSEAQEFGMNIESKIELVPGDILEVVSLAN
ncbi:MAG: translation initiation factor IF-2 [Patescibacteria group bacterium]